MVSVLTENSYSMNSMKVKEWIGRYSICDQYQMKIGKNQCKIRNCKINIEAGVTVEAEVGQSNK